MNRKQAGNGPSRRHIQGSKIAKRLQNFKVLVNWEPSYEFFFEKVSQCPKKLKGRTLWDFSTSILLQNSKKIEGEPFGKINFSKKSLAVPKKMKGGTLWSRSVLYVTLETLLVQFLGPTGTFWRLLKIL